MACERKSIASVVRRYDDNNAQIASSTNRRLRRLRPPTIGDEIHLRQPTPPPHSLRTPTFIGLCQREVRADRQNSGPSPVRNSVEKFRVLRGPSHEHQIMFRVARFTVRSTCRFPRDSSVRKHFNMGHRNYSLFFYPQQQRNDATFVFLSAG